MPRIHRQHGMQEQARARAIARCAKPALARGLARAVSPLKCNSVVS